MALKLPRLPAEDAITAADKPTIRFQRWWQSVVTALEAQEAGQDTILEAIIEILGLAADLEMAVEAAQTAAANAQASADNALDSASAVGTVAKLTNSGTSGLSITAADAGSSVTITISAHTRIYGDGVNVAVSGGTLTGRAYDTEYFIYYDQPTFAGGVVSYQTTTDQTAAAQVDARHLVGIVKTPLAAAPDISGEVVRPPGVGGIRGDFYV